MIVALISCSEDEDPRPTKEIVIGYMAQWKAISYSTNESTHEDLIFECDYSQFADHDLLKKLVSGSFALRSSFSFCDNCDSFSGATEWESFCFMDDNSVGDWSSDDGMKNITMSITRMQPAEFISFELSGGMSDGGKTMFMKYKMSDTKTIKIRCELYNN